MGQRLGLAPGEAEGLEGSALVQWGRERLEALIREEIARLEALRAAFDPEAIARARAGAEEPDFSFPAAPTRAREGPR